MTLNTPLPDMVMVMVMVTVMVTEQVVMDIMKMKSNLRSFSALKNP